METYTRENTKLDREFWLEYLCGLHLFTDRNIELCDLQAWARFIFTKILAQGEESISRTLKMFCQSVRATTA